MMNLAFILLFAAQTPEAARQEAYLDAVRKGDAAAVKAVLDQGVEVDAKFRYDRTALSFAADRGSVEIVKMLLERGADVNAKDTFYNVTAMTWALEKGNVEIVRLLLDKGATGGEEALQSGVDKGNTALVALAIDKVKPTPDELAVALASAEKDGKTEVAEQLRKAGAKPLPPADYAVPADVLAKYAGSYKATSGWEVKLEVKDGVLTCLTCGPKPQKLGAVDGVTFRPEGEAAPTLVVRFEGMKVVGLSVKEGRQETLLPRVEETK
jgi:Ankyrin repeats (many copies)